MPRQARSESMVQAILQAAAEVFAEHGYARGTTNRIAARAGVSIGSLYQYFPHKDALLEALMHQHHADVDRVLARGLDRLSDPRVPLPDGLRALITELVALHEANPALSRALSAAVLHPSSVPQPPVSADPHSVHVRVVAVLAGRPDVRRADYPSMALVVGQATEQLTRWLVHDVPPGVPTEPLVEEIVQLLVRYLSAAPVEPPPSGLPR